MKYPFYPGCAMHSNAREYLESFKAISKYFDVELEEVKGWTCCAPTAVHGISQLLSVAIPAANLAIVEKEGSDRVIVPCAACYSRFKHAVYEIAKHKEVAEQVNECIDYEFKNSVTILHPLEIYNEISQDRITMDLSKVNVAAYYGCLLTRPPKVNRFDDCENPQSIDTILRQIGANVIDWSYKTDCCGATSNLANKAVFLRLTGKILEEAQNAGADIVAVACPLCQINLDTYQLEMKTPNIPALYFSQLIGLAYGVDRKKLGLHRQFVNSEKVIEDCLNR